MSEYKNRIKRDHPKLYSNELVNNLFRHPYTRIEYVIDEVGVGRQTAGRYLDQLTQSGLLEKVKVAQSMRNWATLYSEVELPIGSQDICEQGR
jgi:Fic family protein